MPRSNSRRRSSPGEPRSLKDVELEPHGNVFPSPADWRDVVLYELMIDRFDDGKRHPPYDPKRKPPQKTHARDVNKARTFQGGTLRGIINRLDYLAGLGVSGIWITSPLKNRADDESSYHGYAAQDFLRIDPRFGTLADYRELVRKCHRRGIYVIQDVVIEHAGDVWAYPDDEDVVWNNGNRFDFGFWRRASKSSEQSAKDKSSLGPDDGVWPVEFQDPDVFTHAGRMHDAGEAENDEAMDGDFNALKKLELRNPQVLADVMAVCKYWIAAADIDGFRIDAFRHVHPDQAADFCAGIREYATRIGKTNFMLVGEVPGGNERMLKYVGNNTPLPARVTPRTIRCSIPVWTSSSTARCPGR